MTTMYLIRHGEYENPDYLFPGRSFTGFPLSPRGKEQVKRLAEYFSHKSIAALYSSSIPRCRQTAEIVSNNLSIVVDDRLLEVRTMADGISMKLFDETNGELSYTPEYQAKGAESMVELADRIFGFIEEKRKEYESKEVLIVTHGDPMRFGIMKYMKLPITFTNSRKVAIPLAGGYKIEFFEPHHAQVSLIVGA